MRWMIVIATVVAVLGGTAIAEDDKAGAMKFFKAGEQAYKMSNFGGAAENFEAAFKLLPAPEIAFSAAQAYRLQFQIDQDPRKVKRAIELYEIYVGAVKTGKRAGDAAIHLDNLRAAYRDLVAAGKVKDDKISVDRTQVTVWVPVEGAQITVDGKPVEPYAYFDVAPGEHVVEVTAKGYKPYSQKVSVANGAKVPVPVQLAPRSATVVLAGAGDARIAIDGRPVRTVDGVLEVPAGKRYLTVSRRGRKPYARELTLPPGGKVKVDVVLHRTGQRTVARWAFLGSAVLGGLTVVTITGALYAQSRAEDLIGEPLEDAGDYTTWRDRRNGMRNASIVLGSATILTAGTATALFLFDNPTPEAAPANLGPAPADDELRFTPMGFGGGAGIGVGGVW